MRDPAFAARSVRRFIHLLVAFLACALAIGSVAAVAAVAAEPPRRVTIVVKPGQSEAEIGAAIRAAGAAGREVTIVLQDAAPAASPEMPAPPAAREPPADASYFGVFQAGLTFALRGMRDIPLLFETVARRYDEAASGEGGRLFGDLLLVILLSALIAAGTRRLASTVVARIPIHAVGVMAVTLRAVRMLLVDAASVVLFFVVAWSAMTMWLAPVGYAQRVSGDIVKLVALAGLIVAFARFALAPAGDDGRTLLPIPHPDWQRRMAAAYGIIGLWVGAAVFWSQLAGVEARASEALFLVGSTVLTVLKLVWFGVGRNDIAALFAGRSPGTIRRVLAASSPWLFVAIALAIWVVGCMAAVSPQAAHWGAAAGLTQVLVLAVPVAALGIDALLKAALAHMAPDAPPLRVALQRAGRSLVAGGVWIAGLYAILTIWRSYLVDASALSMLTLLRSTLKIGIALVIGWAILTFLRSWFASFAPVDRPALPGEEAAEEAHPASRLSTILPLFRDMLLGVVIAVTVLVVLSSIGVDIAPLLAGFGVVGLALSFGSQALVRDIVSGIFFIADDAFRLGEYIDTGRHKGTVERISLRSIRLRHQNGQIHTLPFGQIQAITNFSRDWSTVKFELRFEPEADPEAIRKVVKKVGLGLMENPEFGPQFLAPLKMQGIQEITPNAMVVRLKFSARPGNPSALQREAVKRLLPAFRQAGLPLASNAVTVRSGTPEAAAAASALADGQPLPSV